MPAPEQEAKGGIVGAAAKIYQIKIPLLEIAVSYTVDSSKPDDIRVHGRVEDFNPGTNAQVLAITDDETKGQSLSRFSAAIVIGAVGGRLRAQPINVAINKLKLPPGISIRSISPLDPSGWMRVSLNHQPGSPVPPIHPAPEIKPPPVQGATPTASALPRCQALGQR